MGINRRDKRHCRHMCHSSFATLPAASRAPAPVRGPAARAPATARPRRPHQRPALAGCAAIRRRPAPLARLGPIRPAQAAAGRRHRCRTSVPLARCLTASRAVGQGVNTPAISMAYAAARRVAGTFPGPRSGQRLAAAASLPGGWAAPGGVQILGVEGSGVGVGQGFPAQSPPNTCCQNTTPRNRVRKLACAFCLLAYAA